MSRYFLHYAARGAVPADDIAHLQDNVDAVVVATGNGIILVDADPTSIEDFLADRPGWVLTTGSAIKLPIENGRTRAARSAR